MNWKRILKIDDNVQQFKELELAKSDLRASIILHKKKLYPQSIWFLEQGIEKSYKFFGSIIAGFDGKYYQSNIKHKPSQIHYAISEKLYKEAKAKADAPIYAENDLHQIGVYFKQAYQREADSKKLRLQESENFNKLKVERNTANILTIISAMDRFNKGRRWKSYVTERDEMHKRINKSKGIPEENKKSIIDSTLDIDLWYLATEFYDYSEPLVVLSKLVDGLPTMTRYVDSKQNSPLDLFKRDTPMVRFTPALIKLDLRIISDMENLLFQYNRFRGMKIPDQSKT